MHRETERLSLHFIHLRGALCGKNLQGCLEEDPLGIQSSSNGFQKSFLLIVLPESVETPKLR